MIWSISMFLCDTCRVLSSLISLSLSPSLSLSLQARALMRTSASGRARSWSSSLRRSPRCRPPPSKRLEMLDLGQLDWNRVSVWPCWLMSCFFLCEHNGLLLFHDGSVSSSDFFQRLFGSCCFDFIWRLCSSLFYHVSPCLSFPSVLFLFP